MTSAICEDYRVEPLTNMLVITDEQTAENARYVLEETIKVMSMVQGEAETFDEEDRLQVLKDRLADIQKAVKAHERLF